MENTTRNRYTDVHCYDHSRVKLGQKMSGESTGTVVTNDYINANFVDGYRQPSAFIFTQGPLPKTFCDFWQMVWEQEVLVIVMTTRAIEKHKTKCGQYWPDDVGAPPLGNILISKYPEFSHKEFIDQKLLCKCLLNLNSSCW